MVSAGPGEDSVQPEGWEPVIIKMHIERITIFKVQFVFMMVDSAPVEDSYFFGKC